MLTHKGTRDIHTARLHLRRYRMEDAEDIFRNYATDERVTKFLSWTPYSDIKTLKGFISDCIASYSYDNYSWVIEYENQVIGGIAAIKTDEKNESCEIGYCIGYDFWKMGITTEALSSVIHYLFTEVGFHRVFAKHDVENPASGKIMQKCGMVYEGRLRDYYLRHDGTFGDSLVYGILNGE